MTHEAALTALAGFFVLLLFLVPWFVALVFRVFRSIVVAVILCVLVTGVLSLGAIGLIGALRWPFS